MNEINEAMYYKNNGGIVLKMSNNSILKKVEEVCVDSFDSTKIDFNKMERDEFSEYCVGIQEKINKLNIQKAFLNSEGEKISKLTNINKFNYTSIVYLRAVRSTKFVKNVESPDIHRETFYSETPETTKNQHNIWIPIKNVNDSNSLKWIPESHLVNDSELDIEYLNDINANVEKHSAAHKLGFFWKQKTIKNNKLLQKLEPFKFNENSSEYALFSAMTLHGNGINNTDNIRFVIGFGLIDENNIQFNKDSFASGNKYFLRYE